MNIDPFVYDYIINEVSYPDGAVIVEEGGRGRWIYILLVGRLRVMKRTSTGTVCVDTLGPGEIFGEMVLLEGSGGPRSASVIAQGEVKVGILDIERLNTDYEAMPLRLRALLRSLMMELKEVTSRVCDAVSSSS
jgi:CRP/FNR family cyclic AMP-dependent transcriptional regulator